jgi:surfeit locus 1 family protein
MPATNVPNGAQGARRARGAVRRLLPTLAMVAVVALCIAAGNWQRGRMLQKEALGARLAAAAAAPVAALPAAVDDWSTWRFRQVELAGRYDEARQILVDNKVHAARAGYHVVTPLVLADGRAVLVNRGFAPGGATRSELPEARPPTGEVRVRGRVNLPPTDYVELAQAPPQGVVWQNLDPARFAAATGIAVLPIVVEATAGDDRLVRDWPRPDAGTEKHRIYMVQWYAFAALAFGLWAWFTLIRSKR